MSFSKEMVNNCHPPVVADKNGYGYGQTNKKPSDIIGAKKKRKKTPMFAGFV